MNPRTHFPEPDLDFETMRIEKSGWPHADAPLYGDAARNSKLQVCEGLWEYETQTAAKEVLISILLSKVFIKWVEESSTFLNYSNVSFSILNKLFLEFKDRQHWSLNYNHNKLQNLKLLYFDQIQGMFTFLPVAQMYILDCIPLHLLNTWCGFNRLLSSLTRQPYKR